ncbi:hypothetical protein MycrhN_0843 [Mycolicibacterium rhodesiae NBB3]|uniref:Uncharacterized protein n=1 Tax=Mycolicibacterium rhodesiae (strain NBB3) TaxID=710685 RepID=G8RRN3_MYCRN|nr:hypothetical protein [Mycolicibacterium rhodesiae]AEV71474.1 hypothetical protein MycrhN_0843 [Mycolicibacterium rhodesiae NBB3]
MKALRNVSATNVAYVCFLLVFVSLGMLVYALAAGSAAAGIIGAVLVALTVLMIAGFRVGVRTRAASNDSGIDIPGENIWARPLRREQIDRYLQNYRAVRENHEELLQAIAVPLGRPTVVEDRRAA